MGWANSTLCKVETQTYRQLAYNKSHDQSEHDAHRTERLERCFSSEVLDVNGL